MTWKYWTIKASQKRNKLVTAYLLIFRCTLRTNVSVCFFNYCLECSGFVHLIKQFLDVVAPGHFEQEQDIPRTRISVKKNHWTIWESYYLSPRWCKVRACTLVWMSSTMIAFMSAQRCFSTTMLRLLKPWTFQKQPHIITNRDI